MPPSETLAQARAEAEAETMRKVATAEFLEVMGGSGLRGWKGAVGYVEDAEGCRRPVTEPVNETLDEGEKLVFLGPPATATIESREQARLAWWC